MTHEEKTRIIAEFDGWEFVANDKNHPLGYFTKNEFIPCSNGALQYYRSYDWLMPVWHKFRDLRFETTLDIFTHTNIKNMIRQELTIGTVESLFCELAEAIEWYNTTKK